MEEYIKFYDNYERISELIWAIIPDIKNRFKFPIKMENREKSVSDFINILKEKFPSLEIYLEENKNQFLIHQIADNKDLWVSCILKVAETYGPSKSLEEYNEKLIISISQIKKVLLMLDSVYDINTKNGIDRMLNDINRMMFHVTFSSRVYTNDFPLESNYFLTMMDIVIKINDDIVKQEFLTEVMSNYYFFGIQTMEQYTTQLEDKFKKQIREKDFRKR